MARYLSLNYYNGSLGGLQEKPAGINDMPSPGGMSSLDHHWTHGLFGPPEQVVDAYAGTGDRYIYGNYGNMYIPNAHASIYDDYRGPSTDRTEHTDMHGDPYFWQSGGPATNKGQELIHHSNQNPMTPPTIAGANMQSSFGRPVVPREGVQHVPSNIEHFEYETNVEFIEDPTPPPKLPQKVASKTPSKTPSKPPSKPPSKAPIKAPPTCKKPPTVSSGDTQKTTDITFDDDKKQKNKTAVILLLIGVLVCIDLWGEFTHVFIAQYLNKGKEVTWVRYAIYAMAATIAIIIVVQQSGVKVPVCA